MSAFLTEALPERIDSFSKKMRLSVRRFYLRKGIKGFGAYHDALSKKQREEAKRFWKRYTKHFSPLWHELFTAKTGIFSPYYVPVDIHFTEIEERLNDWNSAHGIDNKNNYAMYFPEIQHPKSVFRKMAGIYHDDDYSIISKEKAIQNCIDCGNVIFKVALESGKGGGISFWRTEDGIEALYNLIETLPKETNAQAFLKQHPRFAEMNQSSINTVRVITYASANGIRVISSYFQVGCYNNARLSQEAFGGVCVSIKPDGTLCKYAYDKDYNPSEEHPCGIKYEGYVVQSYSKICEVAKLLHRKMGDFRIVSWDFTVGEDGEPIFIEMNLKYGGIMFHQLSSGPLFGDATEEILDEIFGKKE